MDSQRIRPGNDDEILVLPGFHRGPDLLNGFILGDDVLACKEAAPLWGNLVFHVNPGCSCALEQTHGAPDVDRVAVAGVCVADERYGDPLGNSARVGHHLRLGEQAQVRIPMGHGRHESAHVDGPEAYVLGNAGREGVVREGRQEQLVLGEELAQLGGGSHGAPGLCREEPTLRQRDGARVMIMLNPVHWRFI